MSEKIEPALTPEQWQNIPDMYDICVLWENEHLPMIIAVANNDLPESDPRKITREKVDHLRVWAGRTAVGSRSAAALIELADALESLLPPIQETPER